MRTLLVLSLLLLTACGSESVRSGPAAPSSTSAEDSLAAGGGISRADNDLVVEIDRGSGPERYTLTCVGVVEGDHPRAKEACEHLKELEDPFAPVPADAVCTQVYGGPETAGVTGLWRGDPVDLELSRSDGCRIDQWERLGPLLAPA